MSTVKRSVAGGERDCERNVICQELVGVSYVLVVDMDVGQTSQILDRHTVKPHRTLID